MTMDLYALSPRKSAAETLAETCARRPALNSVLSAFIPLYQARETTGKRLASVLSESAGAREAARSASPQRTAQGIPLLAGASFGWINSAFLQAAGELLPHVAVQPPLAAPVALFLNLLESKRLIPEELTQACLNSDAVSLERFARPASIAPETLVFLTHQVLGPVLSAFCSVHCGHADFSTWKEGYCPVCGSFPSASFLDRADPGQSEFLKGGGGQKHLHCSLCAHEWRFRRGACPACNHESGENTIEYLRAADSAWERVELCRTCKTFVPCVDMREQTANPDIEAAAMGMLHLNLLAVQEGLHPLAPSFWNTFE